MKMRNKQGFTMVELLVVLVIVAILAAVATPIYLANVQRSRASEAVSTMALIRQGLRDYQISGGNYFDIALVANGTVTEPLPQSVDPTTLVATPTTAGVSIQDGVAQYFANTAFSVDATTPDANGASNLFIDPPVVDFLITARGLDADVAVAGANGENEQCVGGTIDTNCSTKAGEVGAYALEMDNSGRTYVCYNATFAGLVPTCLDTWTLY